MYDYTRCKIRWLLQNYWCKIRRLLPYKNNGAKYGTLAPTNYRYHIKRRLWFHNTDNNLIFLNFYILLIFREKVKKKKKCRFTSHQQLETGSDPVEGGGEVDGGVLWGSSLHRTETFLTLIWFIPFQKCLFGDVQS